MDKTDAQNYTPPGSQLLSYGEADVTNTGGWPDYLALGFTSKKWRRNPKSRIANAKPEVKKLPG